MYKIIKIESSSLEGEKIEEGYEPFAVTTDSFNHNIIWFRKEIDEVLDKQREYISRGSRSTITPTKR